MKTNTRRERSCFRAGALVLAIAFSISAHIAVCQEIDSTKTATHVGGGVTVTNNGVSLFPTFSLGRPAAIFNLYVGRKASFEPEFRFSLKGKPWVFLFWWRYRGLKTDKFQFNIGAHPALAFKTRPLVLNGASGEEIVAERYLATEITPSYLLTKNISIGIYYLYSHGFQEATSKHTHFLTVNSNISNIQLSERFYMRAYPQLYYLRIDENGGYYVTATLTLARRNFPLSLHSVLNQPIKTDIPRGDDFVWNISLAYSFRNEYIRK